MITGANGHLGIKLMRALNEKRAEDHIIAVVRSERAVQTIRGAGVEADIRIIDYADAQALSEAGRGCGAVVHLVGIIKESRANTFEAAHELPAKALVAANLDAERIVSLSIIGSDVASANTCLASRGRADDIFLAGDTPAIVLRVPMVLGPDDYASMALSRNGQKSVCFSFRAASLEQPIYSDDVVSAIVAALEIPAGHQVIELAGPESLSRRDLIQRAGRVFNNVPTVISLPIFLGYLLASIFELVSTNPPVTRAMLGVLDHDDAVDPAPALKMLGMSLTPLDTMLDQVLKR